MTLLMGDALFALRAYSSIFQQENALSPTVKVRMVLHVSNALKTSKSMMKEHAFSLTRTARILDLMSVLLAKKDFIKKELSAIGFPADVLWEQRREQNA